MADIDVLGQQSLHRSALAARQFVHRLAPSQVLLADVRPTGPDEFRAVARWPRAHGSGEPGGGARNDPLLVAETLRQLGIYLPLRFYGVPAESRLLVEELRFSLDPAPEARGRAGSEIGCTARAVRRDTGGAAGHMRSLDLRVRLHAEGREFARADVVARVLYPAAYRAVRNRGHARPEAAEGSAAAGATGAGDATPRAAADRGRLTAVDPARVGAVRPRDVLVAVDGRGAVRIAPTDPFHPFFHDHPSDHITGATLIGALQQTAALQANEPRLRLRNCTLRALRFTEPSPPPAVEIGTAGRFEIRQRGTVTATGEAHFDL